MANCLLALSLVTLMWLYGIFMPQKVEQKMIRDEVRKGLKDGSIEANMERR